MRVTKIFIFLCLLISVKYFAQKKDTIENIIIITTDGLRWQEVFMGMDSIIASDNQFNQGLSNELFKTYWANTENERRKKLLPFIWSTMEEKGQLYGNRKYDVNVNVANKFWFSYPGYSEMFCGFADKKINSNDYTYNPNSNVLGFINKQNGFEKKVVAFAAWKAFDKILNEPKSKISVICGADSCGLPKPDSIEITINKRKLETPHHPAFNENEYNDIYTFEASKHYLQKHKPRVIYIGYGETDVWAHWSQYASYLKSVHQFDEWVKMLWETIQNDSIYKNKTALFITTDHGRGDKIKAQWTDHNRSTKGSNHIWFGIIGPGIIAKGEIKKPVKIYQKQFAQTWAELLNLNFLGERKIAKGLKPIITQ